MSKWINLFFFSICFLFVSAVFSQPLNSRIGLLPIQLEQVLSSNLSNHTSIQPYRLNEMQLSTNIDSAYLTLAFEQNLLKKKGSKAAIYLQPYVQAVASGAIDYNENFLVSSGAGIDISASFENKLAFGLTYARMLNDNLPYLANPHSSNFSPGMSDIKSVSNGIYHSQFFQTYLSYSPNKYFNFELGNGKQFIGEGYRSLLLSDNANNSPYFKLSVNFWRLSYTNIWAEHETIYGNSQPNNFLYSSKFQKKYTASHYLDWNISNTFSVGLFETVVWQAKDSLYNRGFDINYANPIIFYRPVEFSVGSPDNVLVGLNLKVKPIKRHIIYGQILLDEFLLNEIKADVNNLIKEDTSKKSRWWGNKYGIQIGWKGFWDINGGAMRTRLEFNLVRPYTYAHSSPVQSYTNYGQSLAHPNGANFSELMVEVRYEKNRITINGAIFYLHQGRSGILENFGDNPNISNISRNSDYGNDLHQGKEIESLTTSLNVSYRLFLESNLQLFAGVWNRSFSGKNITLFSLGLRTDLFRMSQEQ